MKDLYFAAVLGFQAASMTSSISLERPNCARDCLIGWLLKVKVSETVGELLTVWIVEKAFLNLKGAECGNHDPNGVVSDKFRYGCSYKTKSGKCIYFMSFPTEIKSIHCNAIWVWHPRNIFVYQGTKLKLT